MKSLPSYHGWITKSGVFCSGVPLCVGSLKLLYKWIGFLLR